MLKYIKQAILACVLINVNYSHNQKNVELLRDKSIAILNKKNPKAIPEFKHLYTRYEKAVFNFFDKKDKQPLSSHVNQMEKDLIELQNICNNTEFISIKAILLNLKKDFASFMSTIKPFVGTRNYIKLALKIRKFKHLLPVALVNKGDVHLLTLIKHRLNC